MTDWRTQPVIDGCITNKAMKGTQTLQHYHVLYHGSGRTESRWILWGIYRDHQVARGEANKITGRVVTCYSTLCERH